MIVGRGTPVCQPRICDKCVTPVFLRGIAAIRCSGFGPSFQDDIMKWIRKIRSNHAFVPVKAV